MHFMMVDTFKFFHEDIEIKLNQPKQNDYNKLLDQNTRPDFELFIKQKHLLHFLIY